MTDQQGAVIEALEQRARRREDRRTFFRMFGAAAAVTGGMALASAASAQSAPSDADILNFALNLEYLEANFYHYSVFGTPIATSLTGGVGTQGAANGGRKVPFGDRAVAAYAAEIAQDELEHVTFLRNTRGGSAVAQPAIDLSVTPTSAFSSAARSAGVIGAGQSFDPFASDDNFLLGAFLFNDVGVSAYIGAAPLISNKTYLEAAAGILAVEGYHASLVRTTLYARGVQMPSLYTATTGISNARDSLDNTIDDDQGIKDANGNANIVPTDANGLVFGRTTGDVLNIVYLNSGAVTKGGFFPNGVNGTVNMSSAS